MAPRTGKRQGKRNNLKIKSKINPRKPNLKTMKKTKISEKPLENLKWLNKVPGEAAANQSEAIPNWLNSCIYKHPRMQRASSENSSEYDDIGIDEADDKSSTSDASGECDCMHSKYPETSKAGILKHKISSTNSVVAKYIKSGMDHVASFIVESAIRFGEEHGVVIPDKNTPNLYEIMPPNKPFAEKSRKIRFKIPDKTLTYEEDKKVTWRSNAKNDGPGGSRRAQNPSGLRKSAYESKSSSWSSKTDSLEDILPLLEKLKEGGDIVTSDLDIEKLARSSNLSQHDRKRERMRERYRALEKRYKSVDDMSKTSEEQDFDVNNKPTWKRFKRDSLELGRQRLRASTCPRQPETLSPSPY